MHIQICKKSSQKKELVKEILLQHPSADIDIKPCIGMCKKCKSRVIAIVDNNKIKTKTIKKFLKELE